MSRTDPPDFAAARDHVVRELVRFSRTLREGGAWIPPNASLPAAEALAEVELDDRARVEAALRASFLTDPRDDDTFDEHFPRFWYRLRTGLRTTVGGDGDVDQSVGTNDSDGGKMQSGRESPTTADDGFDSGERGSAGKRTVRSQRVDDRAEDPVADTDGDEHRRATYSATGTGSNVKDEPSGPPVEIDPFAVRRFERSLASLADRRWIAARDGTATNARRALRRSVASGGVPLSLPTRERKTTAFRACVLVDVSRSVLDAIDREFLLAFLETLLRDGRSVRAFFFDTDIEEVTEALSGGDDPRTALERAEIAWGGGTQIGASLAGLRDRWPRAVDRRTVTIVLSDGLDVGSVELLETEMAWLSRRSKAVLWLNPLAVSSAYEPTCRGMAAALPYVDGLFAFGRNADLEDIGRQLARRGPRGTVGYQYDFRDRRVGSETSTG